MSHTGNTDTDDTQAEIRSRTLFILPADATERAPGRTIVTDLYATTYGHFARVTDDNETAYVSRHKCGNYDHLDAGAFPVHLPPAVASRREIAVANKIAAVTGVQPRAQFPPGTRVRCITSLFGQFDGMAGTVTECSPEIAASQALRCADRPSVIWVRLDDQDARTPAIGFDLADGAEIKHDA